MAEQYPTAGSSYLPYYGSSAQPGPQSSQVIQGSGYSPAYANNPYTGQVLRTSTVSGPMSSGGGMSVAPIQSVAPISSQVGSQPNQSTRGGDTQLQQLAKTNRNPVQEDLYQKLLAELNASKGPSEAEINAAYEPIFGALGQAESNLRGQLPGLIQEAEAQAAASRGLLQGQRTSATEQLSSQETAAERQRREAEGRQRQTLQELTQANAARFGGASSAGLAASELQGREFQRGVSGINQQAQQAIQQINLQRNQVERDYNQGLQQLEVNRQQAVNDINRRFQDRLLEINSKRGEVESAKAQQRIAAAQELRNAIFQINVQKAQFEADLKSQAQQNTSYLDNVAQQYLSYAGMGQSAVDQAGAYTPNAIPGVDQRATSNQTLTGAIRPEDMMRQGIINTARGYDQYGDTVFNTLNQSTGPIQNAPGIYDPRTGQQIGSAYNVTLGR